MIFFGFFWCFLRDFDALVGALCVLVELNFVLIRLCLFFLPLGCFRAYESVLISVSVYLFYMR